jgi:regulator of sigma D
MTQKLSRFFGLFGVLLGVCLAPSSAADYTHTREQELQRICQELLDAVAPGRVEVWKKYLDDSLVHVDENGVVQTKNELLKDLTPLPPGLTGSVAIDHFQAQFHGNVAVAAYEMQESLDYHGQMLHTRFRSSDTWLKTSEGWRLIAQQVSAVLKDPPAIKLPKSQLCAFDGTFTLTPDIELHVRCSEQGLSMQRAGRPAVEYLPETADVFFAPGSPRSRRLFERNAQGKVVAMLERREGEDIRWVRKP